MSIFIQMTGMSGSGKTTIANFVAHNLILKKFKVEVIDGDEYRLNLCKDLGFSKEDRNTNVRRLAFVGKVLARNGIIGIMSAINPYDDIRREISLNKLSRLVYVKCSIPTLKSRDPKGLYKRALLPKGHPDRISNFTGISDPFEEPQNPDLIIDTEKLNLDQCVQKLQEFIIDEINKL